MKQPESIILAFANVRNDNLRYLNPELQKIRNVLKDAEEKRLLNIIEHNGVTYNSLSSLLNSGKGKEVTMLHFSGHSSKNGLMVQSHDESGVVSKKPLSNLIKTHRKFRFIFLNSCYSKEIAQDLVNIGVPYVIGTSDKVKDEAAAVVSAKFYSLMAKSGKTIEEAFLLTKDYMEDPMNDEDIDIKGAFRTFAINYESEDEYPWQLYQGSQLKEKDKNWVLNPVQSKKKWIISMGIISMVAVLLYWGMKRINGNEVKADPPPDSSSIIYPERNKNNQETTKKDPKENKKMQQNKPASSLNKPIILASPGKKIFARLKIIDSDNKYDTEVTGKVIKIFSHKEYTFDEAGADQPAANYENVVSGQLTLSPPVKSEGAFNVIKMEYTVRLTLRFSDGAGQQGCGQKDYSAKVSTNERDTKDRILQQGLSDVLDQLENETSFPFCVKK